MLPSRKEKEQNCQHPPSESHLRFRVHQNFQRLLLGAQIKSCAPLRNRQFIRNKVAQFHSALLKDLHHSVPSLGRVTNRPTKLELFEKHLIHGELDFVSANPDLCITSHGSQSFNASTNRCFVAGTFKSNIQTSPAGFLFRCIE